MPNLANILTVDLEEWFHLDERLIPPGEWDRLPSRVEPNARALLDLLEGCGARATFFCVGWVASRHQGLIQEIHRRGHELAVHGYLHQAVAPMSPPEFRADLRAAMRAVETATGESVLGYRAPRWSLGGIPGGGRMGRASGVVEAALDALVEAGIRYDSSLAPIVHIGDPRWPRDPYPLRRAGGSILEIPPLVGRRFGVRLLLAGGWGLRRVSNRALRREIEGRNSAGAPAVLDLHTWEMDDDPPRIRLPLRYRMAHYSGLSGYATKIRDLLSGGAWEPAGDYTRRHALEPAPAGDEARPSLGRLSGRPRRPGQAPSPSGDGPAAG